MFSSAPHYAKLKTNLRLVINRLKLLEKKKSETNLKARREIAQYLQDHKPDRARIRVESIIREDFLVEALELIEMYADLCLARFGLIETQKEMDPGLEEAISTLIWAAPRLSSEVQEMRVIAEQFAQKYGKEFAKECVTAQPTTPASGAAAAGAVSVGNADGGGGLESDAKAKSRDAEYYLGQVPPGPLESGAGAGAATPATYTKVSAKVMSKMAVQAPPRHLVERYLMEISKAYSVQFEPDQRVLAEYEANSAKDLLLELSGSVPAAPTMSALAPSHVPPPAANPNYPPAFPTPFQVPGYGPPPPIPSVPPAGAPMEKQSQFGAPPDGVYNNAADVMPPGGYSAPPPGAGFMPPEYTSLPPDKFNEAARGGPMVGMNAVPQAHGAGAAGMNSAPPGGAPAAAHGFGMGFGPGAGARPQYPGGGQQPPPPSGGMLDLNLPEIPTDAPSGGANDSNGAPRDVDYDDIMRRFAELKKSK